MSKISFIKSDDRYYNIERCLSLIKGEIISGIKEAKRIVIHPNCLTDHNQLASTHADALYALLDFIYPYAKTQITLAEGTESGSTLQAFKNYNYLEFQDKFDLAIVDLNDDETETVELLDKNGNPCKASISKTMIQADFIISITPPKTHNLLTYSGIIESTVTSSILRPKVGGISRFLRSQSSKPLIIDTDPDITAENIQKIYNLLKIRLSVIDAFTSMQAEGPINGEMVPSHFAIASSEVSAAEWLACRCLGFPVANIPYLKTLGIDTDNGHFVIGDDWRKNITPIKMSAKFIS
ncbi:MAG: DUF362 domain-containing protein [Patescibacteria group bacterium]